MSAERINQTEQKWRPLAQWLYVGHKSSSLSPLARFAFPGLFTRSSHNQEVSVPSFSESAADVIVPRGRLGHVHTGSAQLYDRGGYPNDPRDRPGRWDFFDYVGRRRAHAGCVWVPISEYETLAEEEVDVWAGLG
jgi:hypothetical protein